MHWEIKRYGLIGSTNDEARVLVGGGALEGTVVVAEGQTAGRGRTAHTWFSPEGKGLYASFILRPEVDADRLSSLTLMAGLAVTDALATFEPVPAQLKWPNDVWLLGRKVGGILCELVNAGDRRPATGDAVVVIGIGLNINLRADEFPPELRDIATSLAVVRGQPLDRELVLQALLHTLGARYQQWQRDGFSAMRADYLECSALEGRRVRITFGKDRCEGVVRGVDDSGALQLETAPGNITSIIAGSVELISGHCEAP